MNQKLHRSSEGAHRICIVPKAVPWKTHISPWNRNDHFGSMFHMKRPLSRGALFNLRNLEGKGSCSPPPHTHTASNHDSSKFGLTITLAIPRASGNISRICPPQFKRWQVLPCPLELSKAFVLQLPPSHSLSKTSYRPLFSSPFHIHPLAELKRAGTLSQAALRDSGTRLHSAQS